MLKKQALFFSLLLTLLASLASKAPVGYINTPPLTSNGVIVLHIIQNKTDGSFRCSLNNGSFSITPCLLDPKEKTNAFDQNQLPYPPNFVYYCIYNFTKNGNATTGNCIVKIKYNTTVDVILQHANTMTGNVNETHSWHLHGHDFWVLGYGTGKYNISEDWKKYNLVNPIMKNKVPLHPDGWTAVRSRVHKPGVWAFRFLIDSCMKMAVVFEEGIEKVGDLSPSIIGCGETKGYHKP